MAEGNGSVVLEGTFEPASPSLQNCIQHSNTWRYFSVLCDFGVVLIIEMKDKSAVSSSVKAVVVERLTFGKGETLEGHAWSSDDELFAVTGHKIYIFKVSQTFSSLHTISLYYLPKDISFILSGSVACQDSLQASSKMYSLAVAGPNGVELYKMEMDGTLKMGGSLALHSDLAIALVQFSPDKKYLAVAALDGHFGIWTVSSLDTDQKEFWYVHLKTVRITSLQFSPDSSMVAVAGWEGSWHLYQKVSKDGGLTWLEFHHGKSTDRVSGDLPGSFVSWSPDSRYVRLTQAIEKNCCVSTFDTQTSTISVVSLEDAVKGITTSRGTSADYSLCILKSRRYIVLRWPANRSARPQISPALEQEQKLLLVQDSLLGSLRVERSLDSGVALQWRPTSKHGIAAMRRIIQAEGEVAEEHQPSETRLCTSELPLHRNESQDGVTARSTGSEAYNRQDPSSSKHGCSLCSTVKMGCGSSIVAESSERTTNENNTEAKSTPWNKHEEEAGSLLVEKNSNVSESGNFNEADFVPSYVGHNDVGLTDKSSEPSQQSFKTCPSSEGNVFETVDSLHQHLLGSQSNECEVRTEHSVTSSSCSEESRIEAPFLNHALFSSPSRRSGTGGLLSQSYSDARVLVSMRYVVVAIFPLLAHVYHHHTKLWRTLLFPPSVVNCCIAQDKYLVLLTADGRILFWCLGAMKMMLTTNEILHGAADASRRCVMLGDPFQSQVSLIDLDPTGKGDVLRVRFKPGHVEACVSVERFPVCFPALLCRGCASCARGSVGHLMIFKHSHSQDCDQRISNKVGEDSALVQWVVMVPELCMSQTFLEESSCSLQEFIVRQHDALCRMEALTSAR